MLYFNYGTPMYRFTLCSSFFNTTSNARVRAHTHFLTHIHMQSNTRIHAYTRARTHTRLYTQTHTYMHTHTNAHLILFSPCNYNITCMHIILRACTCVHTRSLRFNARAYTKLLVHTQNKHIHINTHTYTYLAHFTRTHTPTHLYTCV